MVNGLSVVFEGPGHPLTLRTMEVPSPGAEDIVVRTSFAGVCGSDAHRLVGDVPHGGEPVCFGHEAVGVVEAAGPQAVDLNGVRLRAGDRVYWSPVATCGACSACKSLRTLECETVVWPAPADAASAAGFQELAIVGSRCPRVAVPEDVPLDRVIAFGCAMPTAIAGFARVGGVEGKTVVILGAGPVGLACAVLAVREGARLVVVVGDPHARLTVAEALGAHLTIALSSGDAATRRQTIREELGGHGADIVIEAAGQPSAFPEGFDLLGSGGTLLVLGLYSGSGASAPIDPVRINNLNLSIIGCLGTSPAAFSQTVDIAAAEGERFAQLITHRFPLEETEKAILAVGRSDAVKVVIEPAPIPMR